MVFFIRISFVFIFQHNKGIVQQRAVCMILILITHKIKRLNFGQNLQHTQNKKLCCRWTLNDVEWSEGILNIVKIISIIIHKH